MIALLTITTVFYIALTALSARRKTPAARFFALMVGLAAVWAATVIGEISCRSLSAKITVMQVRLMFICFIPFAWLGLVLALTGKFNSFKRTFFILLLIVPTATAILALTTRFHNQFRYDFVVENIRGIDLLVFERSRWDVLHEINNHAVSLVGFLVLLSAWHSSSGLLRKQTFVLGLSFIIPLIGNILFILQVIPPTGINPTPILMIPASLLQAWVVFGTRILDIIPVARSMVLDQIDVGTIVLDSNQRIADINRAALALTDTDERNVFGRSVNTLPSPWGNLEFLAADRPDSVKIGTDQAPRWIRIEKTPVSAETNKFQGSLFLLKDITDEVLLREEAEQKKQYEQKQKQQRLQQLLLRDIHDGLSGLTSNLLLMSVLAQKEPTLEQKDAWLQKIERTSTETTTELRELMNVLEATTVTWGELIGSLRRTAGILFDAAPAEIRFRIRHVPDDASIGIAEGMSLTRMVRECMNNIVKHAHAAHVELVFNIQNDQLTIECIDDGCGIDPQTITRGRGLNNLEKRAAELNGTFSICSAENTLQTIRIPLPMQIAHPIQT